MSSASAVPLVFFRRTLDPEVVIPPTQRKARWVGNPYVFVSGIYRQGNGLATPEYTHEIKERWTTGKNGARTCVSLPPLLP